MFITLHFTNRERYCKAVRHLMANESKWYLLNRGREEGFGWYVWFSRRK